MIQDVKSTPAQAEDDALAVLRESGRSLTVNEFVRAMQDRGVTVSAAQAVLRMLVGQGLVQLTSVGDIAGTQAKAPA